MDYQIYGRSPLNKKTETANLENEEVTERFCTACQQRRSTLGGEWRKTNYGRNQRWVCARCRNNQLARNAAQKKAKEEGEKAS